MNNTASQPQRILYVENGIGYGGAIICLRHLVRNLDPERFTAMVVTGRDGPQYREIAGEARWRHIPDRHLDIVGAHRRLDAMKWLGHIPGLRFVLNQALGRSDDLFNFLPFLLQVTLAARRFRADLIHANNEPLCNRAALLAGKLLKIPTLCHVRGNLDADSRMMHWAFGLPDYFVPVSEWVSRNIQEKFAIEPERISVVYDGLELDALDPATDGSGFRDRFGLQESDIAVGLVGLLIPWKGQEIFLDAARMLQQRLPRLKMLIVGGTPDDCRPYEQHLRQRVAAEGLEEMVLFTGHISGMPAVYNGLDIVVSASTSPEPLGTVVIESMAMGRPLIGPDHGGAAEMMSHGETGLLFEPGNAEALAAAIERFATDPPLRRELGANARRHALSTFDVETHALKIQQLYERLL